MIVTRFAPSPTGLLHLGHAYAALFAHDMARAAGGRFLLRLENIDRARCRPEFEKAVADDLAWLGLAWEQKVRRQSDHFADYERGLAALDDQGLLYPCFCTRKEIADEIARADHAPQGAEGPIYPGTCRMLDEPARRARIDTGAAFVLRLDIAKALTRITSPLTFQELGRGPHGETGLQSATPARFGDVVLARKDMPASYHLAVVIDDSRQGVTHVTRGADLFAATSLHRLLQTLLDLSEPLYAHHPLILDATGRKFSKRDNAVTLRSLREGGATPHDIRVRLGLADQA
jgi:glutamyl-Q tRNA(Asp) synthetase